MPAWLCPDVCSSREPSKHSCRDTANDRRVSYHSADGVPLHHAPPRPTRARSAGRVLSVTSATFSVKRYRRPYSHIGRAQQRGTADVAPHPTVNTPLVRFVSRTLTEMSGNLQWHRRRATVPSF